MPFPGRADERSDMRDREQDCKHPQVSPDATVADTGRAAGNAAPTMLGAIAAQLGGAQVQRKLRRRAMQRKAAAGPPQTSESVHDAAALGSSGAGGALPHLDAIQRSFGHHDVTGVQAHTDAAATEGSLAMGAEAYAWGDHVAFARPPDLHTAAHEAAHVVQQRAGVQLQGGVGEVGDPYEQHADAVADVVARGGSAEALLDQHAAPPAGGEGAATAVQGSKRHVQRLPLDYETWKSCIDEEGLAALKEVTGEAADSEELGDLELSLFVSNLQARLRQLKEPLKGLYQKFKSEFQGRLARMKKEMQEKLLKALQTEGPSRWSAFSDRELKEFREYLSVRTYRERTPGFEEAYRELQQEYTRRMKTNAKQMTGEALKTQGMETWNFEKVLDWFSAVKAQEKLDTFSSAFKENRMTARQINTQGSRKHEDKLAMDLYHESDGEARKGGVSVTPKQEQKEAVYGRGVPSMEQRMNAENFLDDDTESARHKTNRLGLHEQGATLLDGTRTIESQVKPYVEATTVFMPVPSEHNLRVLQGLEGMEGRDEETLNIIRAYMTRMTKAQAGDMATGHAYMGPGDTKKEDIQVEYGLYGKMEPTVWDTDRYQGQKREATEPDIEERRTRALEYSKILETHKELSGKEIAIHHRVNEGSIFPVYAEWQKEENCFLVTGSKDGSLNGKKISNKGEIE